MQTRGIQSFMFLLILFSGINVSAQDSGQTEDSRRTGLTMGYPASIGLIVYVTDKVAVRPDLSLSRTSTDASGSGIVNTSATSDIWSIGAGVSGLFYVGKWDSLRTYVTPRFAYSRSTTSSSTNSVSAPFSANTLRAYSIGASLGAEYSLGRRFGVFGETGFGYTDQKISTSDSLFRNETDSHVWSTRTGVGAILRF
jgi:hypothetical protein